MDIKLSINYDGVVIINDNQISCFDYDYNPKPFNLVYQNDTYVLTKGNVNQHCFNVDIVIRSLSVEGGLCHLKTKYDDFFTIFLRSAKLHLYENVYNRFIIASLIDSQLIGNTITEKLYIQSDKSIIKGFRADYLYINAFNYTFIKVEGSIKVLNKDDTSNIIINSFKSNL